MHQVVHGEDLADTGTQLRQLTHRLVQCIARLAACGGVKHLNALAQRGGAGVEHHQPPLGILLAQLTGGHHRRLVRAADAGGHAHVENVVALLQQRLPQLAVLIHGDHGGAGGRVPQHFVVGVAVKGGQVKALVLDLVDNIGERQQIQLVPLQLGGGQIGGCIGRDHKGHDRYLSYI